MILVNNPGTWSAIYPPFRHAAWHGWTPTDLIFPFFLFIVGVAIVLSLGRRLERGDAPRDLLKKATRRAVVLFGLGVFMAAWPVLSFDGGVGLRDFSTLRIPGVLQRIAICYLVVTVLFLHLGRRGQMVLAALVLLGYWGALTLIPVTGVGPATLAPPEATLAAWLDRAVLGQHLWSQADRLWDPEGLLSTLPAVVTTLVGVWAGMLLESGRSEERKARLLLGWGGALFAAGWAWGIVFPVNKQLWTSSYVLLTGGLALAALGACYWVIDVRGHRRWAQPAVVYGVNAITVFVASGILAKTLGLIRVPSGEGTVSVQGWIFRTIFAPLGPPELASLAHALVWIGGWYLVLLWMYRRDLVIKV
jgi:predicted acyltransferase